MNEDLVDQLVQEWGDVYKKGQLSFWVLLSLYEKRRYASEITDFMTDVSGDTFEVKEQSLYRALRRFKDMGLVVITEEESPNSGPKRKYYSLTALGRSVLAGFTTQYIKPITSEKIIRLLQAVESEQHNENC